MVKVHMSLWQLIPAAAALYVLGLFVVHGQFLKRRLRRESIDQTRHR
jgi:hypothetical protein